MGETPSKAQDSSRARSGRCGALLLAACLAVSFAVALVTYLSFSRQSANDIERIRTIYTDRTESYINSVFHKTDVLAAVVKLNNGDITQETFDSIAQIVYQPNYGIRGIQYMPGAVVTYSYPVEGNEAVMGVNFFNVPNRRADVLLAIDTRSIALSGPYHLIQGGLGLVARNPVFLTDSAGNEYFWGFSAIVLDLPDALASVGLDNLPGSGYDFQLFCTNENGECIVIAGNEDLDTSKAQLGTIKVPNHEWTLAVTSKTPLWDAGRACFIFLVGTLLSFAVWRLYVMLQREREAMQTRDVFFSDVSHDMRTPLNAIIGFSRLARKPGISDEQRDDYLDKVDRSGALLADLIDDTLTVSKAGQGKLELRPATYDARQLFFSVVDSIASMAADKGVDFQADLSAVPGATVEADELAVQKVLLNLLSNAVRYTPAGGHVRYAVAAAGMGCSRDGEGNPSGGAVTFVATIADDGIGMGEEFQKHLFEPFVQEKRAGYESVGTGLGLSIVKQFSDLMGGTITFVSAPNEGTRFTVRLPLEVVPAGSAHNAPVGEGIAEKGKVDLAGTRVLLCEDNALNAEIAETILVDGGLVVEAAHNGREGLDLFTASPVGWYDVILMDVRMPVMDGITAARAIRALDRADARVVPIVAMTANTFADDIAKCLSAGMNAHLAKPIDPDEVFRAIASLLAR